MQYDPLIDGYGSTWDRSQPRVVVEIEDVLVEEIVAKFGIVLISHS